MRPGESNNTHELIYPWTLSDKGAGGNFAFCTGVLRSEAKGVKENGGDTEGRQGNRQRECSRTINWRGKVPRGKLLVRGS